MAQARNLAAEQGLNLSDDTSVQGMHYLKKALDDLAREAPPGSNRARLVQQTSKDLGSVLEEIAPLYQQARREFQFNSVPINRAEVGERLLESTRGAIRDFSGQRKLQANAFAKALNDEERLIKQSTGFAGGPKSLADFLTPTQEGRVNAVRQELETLANLGNAASGPGSQTAQMLASQNLLSQMAGPLGIPQSFFDSAISQTMMRPVQFAYKAAEPRIGAAIADALLDPSQAQALVQAARLRDAVPRTSLGELYLRRAAPAAIGVSSGQLAGQ
jgi:hypothetical protein